MGLLEISKGLFGVNKSTGANRRSGPHPIDAEIERLYGSGIGKSFKQLAEASMELMKIAEETDYDITVADINKKVEIESILIVGNRPIQIKENKSKYNIRGLIVGYILKNVSNKQIGCRQYIKDLEGRCVMEATKINPNETFIINNTGIASLIAQKVLGKNFNFGSRTGRLDLDKTGLNTEQFYASAIRVEDINKQGLIGRIKKEYEPYVIVDSRVKEEVKLYNDVIKNPLKITQVLLYGNPDNIDANGNLGGKAIGYVVVNVSERNVMFSQRARNGNIVGVALESNTPHVISREVLRELKDRCIGVSNAIIVESETLPYIRLRVNGTDIPINSPKVARNICKKVNGKLVTDPRILPYIPEDLMK